MKFLITFILSLAVVSLIPQEEYKVKAEFSEVAKVAEVSPRSHGVATTASASPTRSEKIETKFTPKSEVERMICEVFGDECPMAIAISTAESGLDCTKRSYQMNTNGTYDHGLFQINDIHRNRYPDANFYDCKTNIQIAKDIRDSWEGWHAWSVYLSGSYKAFIKY